VAIHPLATGRWQFVIAAPVDFRQAPMIKS